MILNLTVVRFPDGTWSYGGKPSSPDYADCEVFVIASAKDEKTAVRKAQYQRRMKLTKGANAMITPNTGPRPDMAQTEQFDMNTSVYVRAVRERGSNAVRERQRRLGWLGWLLGVTIIYGFVAATLALLMFGVL